jgi:hypothetical protein
MWLLLPGMPIAAATEASKKAPGASTSQTSVAPKQEQTPEASIPIETEDVATMVLDPDRDINYDSARKGSESVGGLVNLDEPIGLEGHSMENPPISIAPTLGIGGFAGGALEVPGVVGDSFLQGAAGGMSLRGSLAPGGFGGRSGATKERMLTEGGGTAESEACVTAGLKWIARVQSNDGRWKLDGNFKNPGSQNDTAGTAFGLLPLLAAGHTHRSGTKENVDPFAKPIERALKYLMRIQNKKTGDFGGGMYSHCLATIAMCEAYGMTQDPWLHLSAKKGVDYILYAQHDQGGWRYNPKEAGDTSVTGWAVMALKSAKMGGIIVPDIAFRKAVNYFENSVGDPNNEGYGYAGRGSTARMSAVGLLCRQYLQAWGPQNLRMIKGVKNHILPSTLPEKGQKPNDMYFFYYATQVMHHFGGEEWRKWNLGMRDSLISTQLKNKDDPARGSWDPSGDAFAGPGGRLMYTSLALLTLEVYYRHLPLYYREAGEKQTPLKTTSK